jgi:hypothetical protein
VAGELLFRQPHLFWGVRGGGGNFGIVTTFEYCLHEVTTVLGGAVLYPAAKAKQILSSAVSSLRPAPTNWLFRPGQ